MQSDLLYQTTGTKLLFDLHSQILTVKGGEDYGSCYPNTRSYFSYFEISK